MKKLTAERPRDQDRRHRRREHRRSSRRCSPRRSPRGRIDFEVLKQLLGGAVDEREEKYGLNWHGKRRARQLALTPSTGTLRPCPEESVDWDTTQNLMIEGDNLEVLKLLRRPTPGRSSSSTSTRRTTPARTSSIPTTSRTTSGTTWNSPARSDGAATKISIQHRGLGRFHTDWLNMMYPRLKLAQNLLARRMASFSSASTTTKLQPRRKSARRDIRRRELLSRCLWKNRTRRQNHDKSHSQLHHDYHC